MKTNTWIRLMKLGSLTGWHQRYDRSFVFKGNQFPVCARCTGLFVGYLIGLALSIILIQFKFYQFNILYPLAFALFFTALLGIDGFGQLKGKWESNNKRRLITGLLCGVSAIIFLFRGIFALIRVIRV